MLPQTYQEMHKKYKNLPFLNIMCGSPIRVYYHNHKFQCFVTSMEGIVPMTTKTALCLAQTINDIIKDCTFVDLTYCFPFDSSQQKQKKIHSLSGNYEQSDYTKLITSYLLMLL